MSILTHKQALNVFGIKKDAYYNRKDKTFKGLFWYIMHKKHGIKALNLNVPNRRDSMRKELKLRELIIEELLYYQQLLYQEV